MFSQVQLMNICQLILEIKCQVKMLGVTDFSFFLMPQHLRPPPPKKKPDMEGCWIYVNRNWGGEPNVSTLLLFPKSLFCQWK